MMGWHHAPAKEVCAALDTGGGTSSFEPQFPYIWWEVWAEASDFLLSLLSPKMWGLGFSRVPQDGSCPECHRPPHCLLLQLAGL